MQENIPNAKGGITAPFSFFARHFLTKKYFLKHIDKNFARML